MASKEELKYRVLKYCANNIKKHRGIEIAGALKEMNLQEYVEDARDLAEELRNDGYITTVPISNGRVMITRLTLDGKYFIEDFLKDNSNLKELSDLIESTESLSSVNTQLKSAKKYLLSDDRSDLRNAIKEASGAVETILKIVLKDDKITVGKGVRELNERGQLHKAFKKGIASLYGYNSDSGGIRHGLKEDDDLPDYTEAKFLVNIYSSFVNYVAESNDLI